MRGALLVLLATAPALAQPAVKDPCPACTAGEAVIAKFKLEAVRPLAPELAGLTLGDPLNEPQYQKIVELRRRSPMLSRLGALDETELALVAAALCQHPDNQCTTATTRALSCLAERCDVSLPTPKEPDIGVAATECRRSGSSRARKAPRIGVGLDWGNGWERSRHPNDGRTWSAGIEGRVRLTPKLGIVARADRSSGRDAGVDMDDNGHDDMFTGTITRFSALAGPSFVLDATRYEKTQRFLRLDLLGGYVTTNSQRGEDGLAAGVDLGYQLSVVRLGVRAVQGVGRADSATMVLAHLGIAVGGTPPRHEPPDCGETTRRSTRLALGFELPMGGYGADENLGYMATGLGVEAIWHLSRRFDLVTHADILLYPGYERDRTIHQAALGGLRIDHGPKRRRKKTNWFSTVMAGYTHGAGFDESASGSGPILDLALAWGGQDSESAGFFKIHSRWGLGDNTDYRALFASFGFEIRFDRRKWKDRDRYWDDSDD